MSEAGRTAAVRRTRAAQRFKPGRVKLLLVAESPPAALDRYFYFIDVREHDSLFRYVARGLLGVDPTRDNKEELLGEIKEQGVFLIDLKPDPADASPLGSHVASLVDRVQELTPERVILIKASVYDAAYEVLAAAGLPVVNERIPFPGSGQQRRFEEAFRRAVGN